MPRKQVVRLKAFSFSESTFKDYCKFKDEQDATETTIPDNAQIESMVLDSSVTPAEMVITFVIPDTESTP